MVTVQKQKSANRESFNFYRFCINKSFVISIIIFISILSLCSQVYCEDVVHTGDIVLTGNDVMTIENITYTQTGNIYVRDNAKLTIKNATLIMNMRYHEEFNICISGNATLEILDSTISHSLPNEGIGIILTDLTNLIARDSNLNSVVPTFGSRSSGDGNVPLFKGSAVISNTKFEMLSITFSPLGTCTINITDSTINEFCLAFRDNYQGELSNLKPGFFASWVYKSNNYDINIQNTNINNCTIVADGSSNIVVRDSEVFGFTPYSSLSTITMKAVNSKITSPGLGIWGNTAKFWDLKTGLYNLWKLSEHSTGENIPEMIFENTEIKEGWGVSGFWGANVTVDNSELVRFRTTFEGTKLSANNTTITELMLFNAINSTVHLENTSVKNLSIYVPPNSTVFSGNITFTDDAKNTSWYGPSTVKRIYPATIVGDLGDNPPTASLSLYDKTGALVWSGQTDVNGKGSFEIEFNDNNHDDNWNLAINFQGKLLNRTINLLSSTPIQIYPVYTITATAGPNGAVSPSGSTTVGRGAAQTFNIQPDRFTLDRVQANGMYQDGAYRVSDVIVDGASVGAVTSYTFTNVKADHTISAHFTEATASGAAVVYDSFGGSAIDLSKWNVNDQHKVFTVSAGYLNVNTSVNSNYYHLTSKQIFPGDFDIVLPYKNFQMQGLQLSARGPEINISINTPGGNWAEIRVGGNADNTLNVGTNGSLAGVVTGSSASILSPSGWLRMVRTGTTIHTYYREDDNWHLLGNFPDMSGDISWGIKIYSGESGTFHVLSDGVYSLNDPAVSTYTLSLSNGWNLISLPLQPSDTSISTVLNDISGKYLIVWSYVNGAWKKHQPGKPSDLTTLEAGRGYWIYMSESKSLTITGQPASPSAIQLGNGWNLTGWNPQSSASASDSLSTISDKYLIVWSYVNGAWKKYQPGKPSDLNTFEPGYGYWIKTTGDVEWTQ